MAEKNSPLINARIHDLAGLTIRRVLPFASGETVLRNIGPFVFLDHMGPIETKTPLFVPEHPHIGLATATYLFEGEILHRDSLGSEQVIRPGELNLMTAGRWITHLEQGLSQRLHGLQFWLALPKTHEQIEPSFQHVGCEGLPEWETSSTKWQLLIGNHDGQQSQAVFPARALFLTGVTSERGENLSLSVNEDEAAFYVASGSVNIDGRELQTGQLLRVPTRTTLTVSSSAQSQFTVFGGDTLDGPRLMRWNYVATTKDLIAAAEERWSRES
ncbi:MAG: pirin family protein [Bdellovibrionales bacterium]|nr:pirin family protein [Bdellovibrionales bacterium]